METAPPLIMAFGLPGSGKSTATQLLERRLEGYKRFNADEAMRANGVTEFSGERREEIWDWLDRCIKDRLEQGLGTIVDSIMTFREKRQYFYNLAHQNGISVVSIYCRCSEATALERIACRPENDGLHTPGRTAEVYFKYKRSWEKQFRDLGPYEKSYELVGYSGDIRLAINYHVAVLRYDTDSNTVEIKEKFLWSELRRHAENVRDILLQA